jgi:hypothetical protein
MLSLHDACRASMPMPVHLRGVSLSRGRPAGKRWWQAGSRMAAPGFGLSLSASSCGCEQLWHVQDLDQEACLFCAMMCTAIQPFAARSGLLLQPAVSADVHVTVCQSQTGVHVRAPPALLGVSQYDAVECYLQSGSFNSNIV